MVDSMTIFIALTKLLGGLALFVYGMFISSDSLQKAAGRGMRTLLYRLTKNRVAGFGVGTGLSFLIHSGPVMVMLVGFINAGLLGLQESMAVMVGANVGTTLSMQIVSFDVGKYCFLAIGLGYLLNLVFKKDEIKAALMVLFGFGLIFLGMITMTDAIMPLKEAGYFTAVVSRLHGETLWGILFGLAVSTICTTAMQSSGAMIGITFALSKAGVLTSFDQVFPLVLGAHIGTTTTALLGSIGTSISAKRAAWSHFMFNLLGAFLAIAMIGFYRWVIPITSPDLVHQVANIHTLVQLLNGLIVIALLKPFTQLIIKITPSKHAEAEKSYLDDNLLDTPEKAIMAGLHELRRMAKIAREMYQNSMKGLLDLDFDRFRTVRKEEEILDNLKININNYLLLLAERKLSRRQSIMIQYLMTAASDLERIGDHIETLSDLTKEKMKRNIWFDNDSMMDLMELYKRADSIICLLIKSFEPSFYDSPAALANKILEERNRFVLLSNRIRTRYNERILDKKETALSGIFFIRYVNCFNKLVKHSKTIAVVEKEPFFFIKKHKLDKRTDLNDPTIPVKDKQVGNYDHSIFKDEEEEPA